MTLEESFAGLREARAIHGDLSLSERRSALLRLRALVAKRAEDFVAAISADFAGRSRHETLLTEIAVVLAAIDHAMPRLKAWARDERVDVGWRFRPASARILKAPRGVVGVLAPWNYPVQLALLPVVAALSAGCRVLLKPSELTPATGQLIVDSLSREFGRDIVAAVTGGPEVAAALSRLPLDAILFTGSTTVGRKVMAAAAEGLVPVTLELGGKSPAVVDESADIAAAARDIVAGKLLNAGQTCVAPDYALVPRRNVQTFVEAAKKAARALYPDPAGQDYTAIRGSSARERLIALGVGLDTVPLFEVALDPPRLAPMLVLDPPLDSPIMVEEIFGPLLPVIPYDEPADAVEIVNARPSPLALYWFGRDRRRLDDLVKRTSSGTVAVNDTVIQAAVDALPFGGVGASGFGAHHGRAGFDAFTHRRAVFTQSRWGITRLLRPPYTATSERILRLLLR